MPWRLTVRTRIPLCILFADQGPNQPPFENKGRKKSNRPRSLNQQPYVTWASFTDVARVLGVARWRLLKGEWIVLQVTIVLTSRQSSISWTETLSLNFTPSWTREATFEKKVSSNVASSDDRREGGQWPLERSRDVNIADVVMVFILLCCVYLSFCVGNELYCKGTGSVVGDFSCPVWLVLKVVRVLLNV